MAEAIHTIIPWVFAVLAFLQVVIKEGYVDADADDDADDKKDSDDKPKEKPAGEKKEKLAASYDPGSLKQALFEAG